MQSATTIGEPNEYFVTPELPRVFLHVVLRAAFLVKPAAEVPVVVAGRVLPVDMPVLLLPLWVGGRRASLGSTRCGRVLFRFFYPRVCWA